MDDRLIPVRVQLREDVRADIDRIGALRVATAAGDSVPLRSVAEIEIAEGPSVIERLNRERIATIGANLPVGVALGTASARFRELTDAVELPPSRAHRRGRRRRDSG